MNFLIATFGVGMVAPRRNTSSYLIPPEDAARAAKYIGKQKKQDYRQHTKQKVSIFLASTICNAAPYHPLYSFYVAPAPTYDYNPIVRRPAVFAPEPPPRHYKAPLIHNTITYRVDPDADPEEPMEVAQFHSQDTAGRVVFGFNTPHQSRMEARAMDGSVRGSYTYEDPTGRIVKMHYWDDGTGFHTMGNNLPAAFFSPPQYTPEVQAARERHLQLYREALTAALASGSGTEDEEIQSETAAATPTPADSIATEAQDVVQSDKSQEEDDSDAVAVESTDFSLRIAPITRGEPVANRKQVAQIVEPTDLRLDDSASLAIARTGADGYQYLIPVGAPTPGSSESLHATQYGAVPVAAVHDQQTSPLQADSLDSHQIKPVLLRTGLAKTA